VFVSMENETKFICWERDFCASHNNNNNNNNIVIKRVVFLSNRMSIRIVLRGQ
jgi:hypothetical protein